MSVLLNEAHVTLRFPAIQDHRTIRDAVCVLRTHERPPPSASVEFVLGCAHTDRWYVYLVPTVCGFSSIGIVVMTMTFFLNVTDTGMFLPVVSACICSIHYRILVGDWPNDQLLLH